MTNVRVDRLVKRYGDTAVVNGIDIDIAQGEFIVLLGPSGCGKTTTLRCIAGLEDIDGGRIEIGGETVSEAGYSVPPEKRHIGMVFQSYAVWPHLSVFENVAFSLKLQRLDKAQLRHRAETALSLVGLSGFGERGAHQLSGGQLQRVALARAVVAEPQVLLFDEPLSNLDAALRERMRFELRQLQQQLAITSIYVTHDQQEAMAIADRIVLMDAGRIVQMDTPRGLYRGPNSLFAAKFIGNANVYPGAVIGHDGETRVRLAEGLELASRSQGFQPGQPVHVAFRPEEIRFFTAPADGPNTFRARIRHNVFLGNVSDLSIAVAGLTMRGQCSPPVPWAAETDIWAHVPSDAVMLLPRDGDPEDQNRGGQP